MNSPVEPCSIVLISMYLLKGFFFSWLLAMLSTVFSSRNLLRKQFSCELHIKKASLHIYCIICSSFICATLLLWEVLFFLALTGIWRQSDTSSAFLTSRLRSGYVLEALHLNLHQIFFSHTDSCLGSSVQTTSFPVHFFHNFHLRYKAHTSSFQFYCLWKYSLLWFLNLSKTFSRKTFVVF